MARIRTSGGRTRPRTEAALLLALGAIGGVLLGVAIADRLGGLDGLRGRLGSRTARRHRPDGGRDDEPRSQAVDAVADDDEIERRVLEAFRNDPVLAHRVIDISADEAGVTLTGWVRDAKEQRYATVLARGVPGVSVVRSELAVMPITFPG